MGKSFVYVVIENGIWDYEMTDEKTETFDSFKKALQVYNEWKELAIIDMKNFIDEDETITEEDINEKDETCSFEIYQNGDYTKTHDTIIIKKCEVQ